MVTGNERVSVSNGMLSPSSTESNTIVQSDQIAQSIQIANTVSELNVASHTQTVFFKKQQI